jgi:hypothetical protein
MACPEHDPPLSTRSTVIVLTLVAAVIVIGLASWLGWF